MKFRFSFTSAGKYLDSLFTRLFLLVKGLTKTQRFLAIIIILLLTNASLYLCQSDFLTIVLELPYWTKTPKKKIEVVIPEYSSNPFKDIYSPLCDSVLVIEQIEHIMVVYDSLKALDSAFAIPKYPDMMNDRLFASDLSAAFRGIKSRKVFEESYHLTWEEIAQDDRFISLSDSKLIQMQRKYFKEHFIPILLARRENTNRPLTQEKIQMTVNWYLRQTSRDFSAVRELRKYKSEKE